MDIKLNQAYGQVSFLRNVHENDQVQKQVTDLIHRTHATIKYKLNPVKLFMFKRMFVMEKQKLLPFMKAFCTENPACMFSQFNSYTIAVIEQYLTVKLSINYC